ncbi:ubiquitin carboxyl-terminal hydrolase [Cystoisospora suis]|uniref:Ubiquitin carboxyl-terminal hydrolase n=1 Tax=Cystoisospora suis TaxID=483139 RepID=A0A2C6KJ15_9APIC|nr:ubiquitin carboxyl-terminal hydrolase [Cystoisospora suis]
MSFPLHPSSQALPPHTWPSSQTSLFPQQFQNNHGIVMTTGHPQQPSHMLLPTPSPFHYLPLQMQQQLSHHSSQHLSTLASSAPSCFIPPAVFSPPSSSPPSMDLPVPSTEVVSIDLYRTPPSKRSRRRASSSSSSSLSLKPVGLRNLGNTCYLNSLLQALFLCDAFVCNLFRFTGKRRLPSMNATTSSCSPPLNDSDVASTGRRKKSSSTVLMIPNRPLLREMQVLFAEMLLASIQISSSSSLSSSSSSSSSVSAGFPISPESLLLALPDEYHKQQQQDVSEAARAVFEGLGGQNDGELIRKVFAGDTAQVVECTACGRQSRREETIHDFDFPVPSQAWVEEQKAERRKARKKKMTAATASGSLSSSLTSPERDQQVDLLDNTPSTSLIGGGRDSMMLVDGSLKRNAGMTYVDTEVVWNGPSIQECFDTYVKKERLWGENAYACETCKGKREAYKWHEITSPPAHLVVILNRYAWNIFSNDKKKIPTHIHINPTLNVCSYRYELYAAIIHSGATANSGHYYCIGRRSETQAHSASSSSGWGEGRGGETKAGEEEQGAMTGDFASQLNSLIHPGAGGGLSSSYCPHLHDFTKNLSSNGKGPKRKNVWFRFDDSTITQVDANTINSISADTSSDDSPYMIFYRCVQAPPTSPCVVPKKVLRAAQARLDSDTDPDSDPYSR